MKNLLALLLTVVSLTVFAADKPTQEKPATQGDSIVLEEANTIAFRNVVTDDSVKTVQDKLFRMSNKLPKSATIYLVLDTPGGSIDAGLQLINSIKAVPQEVKTITSFSASMGYQIVQHSGERLILPSGTLMSHRARIGESGQIPGEFNTRVNYWAHRIELLDQHDAERTGLSLADYQKLTFSEYWVDGAEAVKAKQADRVVNVTCANDLMDTEDETLETFFGPVSLTWSKCPLITTPLKIDFGGVGLGENSRYSSYNSNGDSVRVDNSAAIAQGKIVRTFFLEMVGDKKSFVENYILTGKFREILR